MPAPGPSAEVGSSCDVAALTRALTLEEKAALTVGIDNWRTAGVPRLAIPSVKTTDGPNGARGDTRDHVSVTPSVCIPSATSLGATWDPGVVKKASAIVARRARQGLPSPSRCRPSICTVTPSGAGTSSASRRIRC